MADNQPPAGWPQNSSPPGSITQDEHDLLATLRIKDVGQLLVEAHRSLLIELLVKLQTNKATHQELAILRNLLRDNGMILAPMRTIEQERRDAERPPADLPELPEPDYEQGIGGP